MLARSPNCIDRCHAETLREFDYLKKIKTMLAIDGRVLYEFRLSLKRSTHRAECNMKTMPKQTQNQNRTKLN